MWHGHKNGSSQSAQIANPRECKIGCLLTLRDEWQTEEAGYLAPHLCVENQDRSSHRPFLVLSRSCEGGIIRVNTIITLKTTISCLSQYHWACNLARSATYHVFTVRVPGLNWAQCHCLTDPSPWAGLTQSCELSKIMTVSCKLFKYLSEILSGKLLNKY